VSISGVKSSYTYTGKPIQPAVTVKNGDTTLKAGKDYKVAYIKNVKVGTAYVYIRGLGSYSGYKLVPFKITSAAKTTATTTTTASSKYKKGATYKITADLNMRKGPGTSYGKVKRSSLSKSMKKKTYNLKYAVLKPGKKVKCTKVSGNWIKVSGGWICCKMGNEVYVK
jgi:hypothetical protein